MKAIIVQTTSALKDEAKSKNYIVMMCPKLFK
jgi:hypothetical protein